MKKCNVKNTGAVIRNIISIGLPGDLDFCRVDLTRDDNGNYYLDCEGGARSAFGVYRGYPDDSWHPGAVVYRVENDDDKRRVDRACYLIENRARVEEENYCAMRFLFTTSFSTTISTRPASTGNTTSAALTFRQCSDAARRSLQSIRARFGRRVLRRGRRRITRPQSSPNKAAAPILDAAQEKQ